MAIIKCKMCGGDLILTEGATTAECEYCGSLQTVPTADNEKKLTLFARANRLRSACEFDKAAGIYESIVADFPEEAEAYWGLVLCKYGIEYVDDPGTGKKIPTCHRSSFDSVMDDENFDQACENADAVARRIYRDEAKQIEEIRKGIIEVSGKEEPYDIFICYKETAEDGQRTLDSVIAQDVYDALTSKEYRVFFSRITLEDKLGTEYEPYIFAALNSAKVMLAFGTDYEHFNAVWVKNEWSRFLKLMVQDKSKHLIPCYKGIDAYDMPKEFAKLQAQDMGKIGAMQDLIRGVEKVLPRVSESVPLQQVIQPVASAPGVLSLYERGKLYLEDHNWASADTYFEKTLDIDPKYAPAYIGKLCVELELTSESLLGNYSEFFESKPNFQKALRFADEEYAKTLEQYCDSVKENHYSLACNYMNASEYEYASTIFSTIKNYKNAKELDEECIQRLEEQKKQLAEQKLLLINRTNRLRSHICITDDAIYGLRIDGTIVAHGISSDKKNHLEKWKHIIAIDGTYSHTLGLRSDGTVVACGNNKFGQCNVEKWTDIIDISVYGDYSLGLRSDGTVVFCGNDHGYPPSINSWKNITAISAGKTHFVGLRADGTVVSSGANGLGQRNVDGWSNIVAVVASSDHTVGLCADGTVVACGENVYGQCNVAGWNNIIGIAASPNHTVGLRLDGTVVACGSNSTNQCEISNWDNIVALDANIGGTIGLRSDGTIVTCGELHISYGNPDWKLFESVDSFEDESTSAKERFFEEQAAAIERKILRLKRERAALKAELPTVTGLFAGKRRREIEDRLDAIRQELRRLNPDQ